MIEQVISGAKVRQDVASRRSPHQQMIDAFMRGGNQRVPMFPTEPSDAEKILRATLMFEEVMETINGLGVMIVVSGVASLKSRPRSTTPTSKPRRFCFPTSRQPRPPTTPGSTTVCTC